MPFVKVKAASQGLGLQNDGTTPRFAPKEIVIGNFAVPQTEGVPSWRPGPNDEAGKHFIDEMAKVLQKGETTVG
jgi:hypothetical protein